MKRLLLFCLLLFVRPCFAQLVLGGNLSSIVNAPIDQNGWSSFKLTLIQNVNFAFVLTPPAPLPGQSTVRVIFIQDGTGGRTVTFAANISNPCSITSTANALTICQFLFDSTTATWQGFGAAGAGGGNVSASGSPAANQIACWASGTTITGTATDVTTTHGLFATASGCPAFRAVAAGDIPTLNQNTTGTAANLTAAAALPNGTTCTTQAAASNDTKCATDAYVDGHFIANGTAAMGTAAISSGACATVVTVSAAGVATTDVITTGFNGDPTAVTGYGASATGAVLTIYPYPTANNVNFKVCNSSSASITPSALTLNWKVTR